MLVILIAGGWILGLVLVAALCAAARRGEAVEVIAEGGSTAALPRSSPARTPRALAA